MCAQATTLVNGQAVSSIDVHDRGLQYGDGVFETIAVHHGKPLLWERHMARLCLGADRLGINAPADALLRSEASALCAGASRGVLKIVVTRGSSGRGYAAHGVSNPTRVLSLSAWPDYPHEFARNGVSICICDTVLARNPALARIKHLNRLEQVLARAEWRTEYADGVMCDDQGNVVECTMSNIFLVSKGELRTPEIFACGVEGVMRAVVLDAAKQLNIRLQVGRITIDDLRNAEEIFLTNSLIGVWPVRQLQDNDYVIGPVTRKIQQGIRDAHCFDRL
jgi:4-amino-4-deoxychorismate lyase